MATKETGWYARHSASVSETNSTASVTVTSYWQNDGWTYQIGFIDAWVYCNGDKQQVASNGAIDTTSSLSASAALGSYTYSLSKGTSKQSLPCKTKIVVSSGYVNGTKYSTEANVTINARPSYTVSYNANGGSGVPSSQTKWYKIDLTLSSSVPTRTGYTFAGWNTNASGTGTNYAAGATYTGNEALTLYAKWTPHTYAVSYNANGGSGAPSNQTKTYGVNLTLSTTKPTRADYNFLGWSTSANGGVVYAPGATYSNNSAVTLYAVWELAYVRPRITNFDAYRCTSDGTPSETGTYVKASFNWATDYEVVSMYIDWTVGIDWDNRVSEKVTASGTSGSVSQIVGGGNISSEITYSTRSWVKDSGGWTYSDMITIGTVKFPIDVKAGGTGVAIGKVAEKDAFEVGMEEYVYGDIHIERYESDANARYFARRTDTGTEIWMGVGSGGVNHGLWSTKLNKWLIYSDGTDMYLGNSTGTYKIDGPIQIEPTSLYDNSSGTNGTVTLSESAENFSYLEIFYVTKSNENSYGSVKIFEPNGKIANLSRQYDKDKTYGVYLYAKDAQISGTTITVISAGWQYIGSDGYIGSTDYIYITKVLGYK